MSDSDDKLTLRDQFALSIINGIFSGIPSENASGLHYHLKQYWAYYDSEECSYKKDKRKEVENICRFAYDIADIMRKVRLDTFG